MAATRERIKNITNTNGRSRRTKKKDTDVFEEFSTRKESKNFLVIDYDLVKNSCPSLESEEPLPIIHHRRSQDGEALSNLSRIIYREQLRLNDDTDTELTSKKDPNPDDDLLSPVESFNSFSEGGEPRATAPNDDDSEDELFAISQTIDDVIASLERTPEQNEHSYSTSYKPRGSDFLYSPSKRLSVSAEPSSSSHRGNKPLMPYWLTKTLKQAEKQELAVVIFLVTTEEEKQDLLSRIENSELMLGQHVHFICQKPEPTVVNKSNKLGLVIDLNPVIFALHSIKDSEPASEDFFKTDGFDIGFFGAWEAGDDAPRNIEVESRQNYKELFQQLEQAYVDAKNEQQQSPKITAYPKVISFIEKSQKVGLCFRKGHESERFRFCTPHGLKTTEGPVVSELLESNLTISKLALNALTKNKNSDSKKIAAGNKIIPR